MNDQKSEEAVDVANAVEAMIADMMAAPGGMSSSAGRQGFRLPGGDDNHALAQHILRMSSASAVKPTASDTINAKLKECREKALSEDEATRERAKLEEVVWLEALKAIESE